MKINFDQVLKDLDGKPIKDMPRNPKEDLKLKDVCVNALLANIPNEKIDGKEKLERYENALIIKKGGVISLTAERITLLKKLIGQVYNVLVSGQVWLLLDEGEEEK